MSRVYPQLRTVRELLSAKYSIDFYQREYEWKSENIEELFTDLEAKFTSKFDEKHEREQVKTYPHYFLGTIITCTEGSKKNIVDGQQRLTTLTLLLIFLHHLQAGRKEAVEVNDLIFSVSYGRKSFNLDVPERTECMRSLFENGAYNGTESKNISVQNLMERFEDIKQQFPESLTGNALPYFVDWLVDNVDLVEIETSTDDDAFTIFETMNDRGVSLDSTDMLKGYLLGNINDVDEDIEYRRKTEASQIWKEHILQLREVTQERKEGASVFFKDWLRAKYAETIRESKKGAKNRDFENIDKYHRWIRDERARIGLTRSDDFYDFIIKQYNRFASIYTHIMRSTQDFTPGFEYIFYNAHNGFTLQTALILAPLHINDDTETLERKIRLVAGFIDIFNARRIVNFRTRSYSSIKYTMFNLMKKIRDLNIFELADVLKDEVNEIPESFEGIRNFYMHAQNRQAVLHMLSRITYHIEQECGIESSFATYVSRNIKKPFEIEHLWGNIYERHTDEFSSIEAFRSYRDRFGGLILLPRGFNQSLGADSYEQKVKHYNAQNLLARSLNSQCYEKNPNFRAYVERSGLPFQSHEQFKKADLDARQDLYRYICEEIWSPARFDRELL